MQDYNSMMIIFEVDLSACTPIEIQLLQWFWNYQSIIYYFPILPWQSQERSTFQYLPYLWKHPKQNKYVPNQLYLCLAFIWYFPKLTKGRILPEIATLIFNVGQCDELLDNVMNYYIGSNCYLMDFWYWLKVLMSMDFWYWLKVLMTPLNNFNDVLITMSIWKV